MQYRELSPEQKAKSARQMRQVYQACLAQRASILYASNRDVPPTLPQAGEAIFEISGTTPPNSHTSERYQRESIGSLMRFVMQFAPSATFTPGRLGQDRGYVRATEYDANREPIWSIAENNSSGNAIYIWHRDHSLASPDEAFQSTKRNALDHGCLRIVHPADNDHDKLYETRVLEVLTNPIN